MTVVDGGEETSPGFQIAPMVDVVFVLLLFFMAITGNQLREGFFDIPLPAGPSTQAVTLFIDIDTTGNVSVNGSAASETVNDRNLGKLRDMLSRAVQDSPDDPVVIRPSLDARHERVVDVLNVCRQTSVKKLSFQ